MLDMVCTARDLFLPVFSAIISQIYVKSWSQLKQPYVSTKVV